MKSLKIVQLKPNPRGKDRDNYGSVSPAQLAAEWVDFTNSGSLRVDLAAVHVYHVAFSPSKPNGEWALVIGPLQGVLESGKVVRIHSGSGPDISVIRPEDLASADYHLFTGMNRYLWNNREGDTAGLWDQGNNEWIDRAGYDPNPPEGVVLVRVGNKLEPPQSAQRWGYR